MRLTDAQRYALEASGLSDHQQAEFCRRTARHNVRRLASQLGPAAAIAARLRCCWWPQSSSAPHSRTLGGAP
jgi:hypothetical protein